MSFFVVGCQDPPTLKLEQAKTTLAQASRVGALKHSLEKYRAAEKLVQDGWMEVARQNGRFAPFRDYKKADSILTLATETAKQAIGESEEKVRNWEFLIQSDREQLFKDLLEWREALNGALARNRAEHFWNSAELAYKTSEKLLLQREYEEARRTVAEGKDALRRLAEVLAEYVNDEARKIHVWRRWVNETLADSRARGIHAVIVDKSKHKTYLVNSGKLVHKYDCELGYNAAHQKLFAGDGATPEGKYEVTAVKTNGSSKYYKALLISYPNATDRVRFAQNKAKGIISRKARIGGLIEIHGEGGRGKDWTEGCVALTNGEMDHLMRFVGRGTPVTIVRRSDQWP